MRIFKCLLSQQKRLQKISWKTLGALFFSLLAVHSASAFEDISQGSLQEVKEGFAESPTEALRKAWAGTLFVDFDNGEVSDTGTMSIVYQKTVGADIYLGLLTARHVLINAPPKARMDLYQNVRIDFSDGEPEVTEALPVNNATVVGRPVLSSEQDLAFVVVKIPAKSSPVFPSLQSSSNCQLSEGEPLVAVSFPAVYRRPHQAQHVPIAEPKVVTKRWSSGVYVGDQTHTGQQPGWVYGTSIDSLEGSSGAPILNRQGQLVGILSGGLGNHYVGSETTGHLKSTSYIVRCSEAQGFAARAWQSLLAQLPRSI